ncbi:hypothetical protein PQ455_09665 [Sphingomonas naphthae]|uniref:Uncharacterized protein n=1 Tax=Sphingomonas naphthae TaxID=1813468 RepID=A0ABY7TGG9_9SPHN|nr:hypothetical protein [Sphingomonas naphthae]WCT71921.1 hypothetical protein PQ455_09665 [Sphingomonas naphthae]
MPDPQLSPEDRFRLERTRFAIISAMRASGVVLMLFGLWIWVGDLMRAGGVPAVGFPIFALGFAESLIVPQILARRWRTPRG